MINTILNQYQADKLPFFQQEEKDKLEKSRCIFIFGAGNNGKRIADILIAKGYPLAGFIDETPEKQGDEFLNLPIFSTESAASFSGDKNNVLVIVSIYNPYHSFNQTRKKLMPYPWHCISILHLARIFPVELAPFYFLGNTHAVFNKKNDYQALSDLLVDERSKQELLAQLNFRIKLDFDGLLEPTGQNFSYLKDRLPPDIYFIDGGAFDGDTVRAFLELVNDTFSNIAALEPDTANFAKLYKFHQSLDQPIRDRIAIMNAGIWSQNGTMGFHSTATTGSSLHANAPNKITVVSIDEHFQTDLPLLLKLDVEGAEREALNGAKRFLREGRAIVVVAVYHQPDDLCEIPQLIHSINNGYRFGLRSHGNDGADLMLYAFPPIL